MPKKTSAKKVAPQPAAKKPAAKKPAVRKPVPKLSPNRGKSVAGFIDAIGGWRAEAMHAVRKLVLGSTPDVTEAVKWSRPVFELGGPFSYLAPNRDTVTFGFWRGTDLDDPAGLLEGTGDRMRHIKLRSAALPTAALRAFIQQAVALNRQKGDPTKRR
jgi:hypothetical protein